MIDLSKAILAINPNALFSVNAEDVNQITWNNGTQPIAKNIILAKQKELQAEYKNKLAQEEQRKQSAISKLKAIGLTDEEINSLLGK